MSLLQLQIHNMTWIENSENQVLVLSSWLRPLRAAEFYVKKHTVLFFALQACFVVMLHGILRLWN